MIKLKRNALSQLTIVLISIFLFSCSNNYILNKNVTIPESGWKAENKISFDVEVKDTKTYYDVFLNVRHADEYPYSNLFVFLTTTYPDGKKTVDTLECVLANQKGEWKGDGAGDIWDNKIPLKHNMVFKEQGKYTFSFEQGMRTDPLPLIMDFGMQIEKVK